MPYIATSLYPLTSGIHQGIAPHRLPPGFSPRMQNIRIRDGDWSKRPALIDFNGVTPLAGTITGLFEYRQENGVIDVIAVTGGAAIGNRRVYRSGSGVWTDITDATLTDGAGNNDLAGSATDIYDATVAPSAASLTTLYMSSGHITPNTVELVKWTGAGNALPMQTGPGPARCLATFANRLILGNLFDTATGAVRGLRVAWSGDGDAESWAGADSGAVDLIETADSVTRLLTLRGRLCIYKEQSLFIGVETGISTIPIGFSLMSRNIGAIAGGSVASAADRHFFLGQDNVYEFDAASPPRPIGDQIRRSLVNINPQALRSAFSMVDNTTSEYWLFVPEGAETYPAHAWVYNYAEQTWSRWEFGGQAFSCGSRAVSGSAKVWSDYSVVSGPSWSDFAATSWAELLTSGPATRIVANTDKTTDEISSRSLSDLGSTAIDAFWESPDIDFNGATGASRPLLTSDLKVLRRVEVRLRGPLAQTGALDGFVSTDGGASFINMTRQASAASDVVNFYTWTTGARFRVRLRNATASQNIPGVSEIALHCQPVSIR